MTNLTAVPSGIPEKVVLDSWPFAEQILRGASIPRFRYLMQQAAEGKTRLLLSEINLGELYYLLAKAEGEARAETVIAEIRRLPVDIVHATSEDILKAARLKGKYNISFADGFCAALAVDHSAPVLTGDPDFRVLEAAGVLVVDWLGV